MKIAHWIQVRRLNIILAVLFFVSAILFGFVSDAEEKDWAAMSMGVCMLVSLIFILYAKDAHTDLCVVRRHLGIEDLCSVSKLSSSQLEELCLQRLRVLASELVDIEKRYNMPMANERLVARSKLQRAYRWFTGYKLINTTPWENFFPTC